jgi:hypothetical protein
VLASFISTPDQLLGALEKKANKIEERLDQQTAKYLFRFQKQERRLYQKLVQRDSLLAIQLFDGVEDKYRELQNAPAQLSKYASVYSGHLDSLTTSLQFLKANGLVNSLTVDQTLSRYTSLQSKLNQADAIKKYVGERQKLLKEQLQNLGMVKELRGFQKQAYYYQAQVRAYKELFEDPSKMEEKLIEAVQKIPQFNRFFEEHSQLASIFSLSPKSAGGNINLAGLQTRSLVNQSLIDRFGSGPNVSQMLQQNMQQAEGQLSSLKNKISSYVSGNLGSSSLDMEMPEGFKPNMQKAKTFFKRLEYGANLQSLKGSSYFPVTSDLGLSLGYKISNDKIIGIGASYKIGWGSNWDHIKLSQQGVGLRSYLDIKIKGNLYLSGGLEYNYQRPLNYLSLPSPDNWHRSGLVGMSKSISGNSKLFKKTKFQVLWDFLSYNQKPRSEPIKFRLAYNF